MVEYRFDVIIEKFDVFERYSWDMRLQWSRFGFHIDYLYPCGVALEHRGVGSLDRGGHLVRLDMQVMLGPW